MLCNQTPSCEMNACMVYACWHLATSHESDRGRQISITLCSILHTWLRQPVMQATKSSVQLSPLRPFVRLTQRCKTSAKLMPCLWPYAGCLASMSMRLTPLSCTITQTASGTLAQDSLSHGKGGHSHVLAHVGSQAQHHQPAWALVLTECVELCLDLYCTIIGWTCIVSASAQKHSSGTAEQRWVWGDQLNSEKAVMSYKCVICGKTTMITVSAA